MYLDYKKLEVWQSAYSLSLKFQQIADSFPDDEQGISAEIKNISTSIPLTIAEACSDNISFSKKIQDAIDLVQELQEYLMSCKDLGYVKEPVFVEVHDRLSRLDLNLDKLKELILGDFFNE